MGSDNYSNLKTRNNPLNTQCEHPKKTFQVIMLHTRFILDFSVIANSLLEAMEILDEKLKAGCFVEKIKPVKKNVQIAPFAWVKQYVPGGIIIVDKSNRDLYVLEFADELSAVLSILRMDIAEMRCESVGSN